MSLDQPVTGSSPVHLVVVTDFGHNRHDSHSAALVFLRPIQQLARAAMMKNAQAGNYWPWRCEERTGKLMLLAPARFMAFSPSPRRENRSCYDTRFALTGTADRSNHSMTIPCLSPQWSVLASAIECWRHALCRKLETQQTVMI